MCIVVFSGTVFALLGYVYWATTNYVHGRCDRAIAADRALLVQAYDKDGRYALVNLINQRVVGRGFEAGVYLLLDPASVVAAGNLRSWPPTLAGIHGWADFAVPEAAGHLPLR